MSSYSSPVGSKSKRSTSAASAVDKARGYYFRPRRIGDTGQLTEMLTWRRKMWLRSVTKWQFTIGRSANRASQKKNRINNKEKRFPDCSRFSCHLSRNCVPSFSLDSEWRRFEKKLTWRNPLKAHKWRSNTLLLPYYPPPQSRHVCRRFCRFLTVGVAIA